MGRWIGQWIDGCMGGWVDDGLVGGLPTYRRSVLPLLSTRGRCASLQQVDTATLRLTSYTRASGNGRMKLCSAFFFICTYVRV